MGIHHPGPNKVDRMSHYGPGSRNDPGAGRRSHGDGQRRGNTYVNPNSTTYSNPRPPRGGGGGGGGRPPPFQYGNNSRYGSGARTDPNIRSTDRGQAQVDPFAITLLRRNEKLTCDISSSLMGHTEAVIDDSLALPSHALPHRRPIQLHPAWRAMVGNPRDLLSHMTAPIATHQCCSGGRQKRVAVHAMGWSKEGRRLVSTTNEGRYSTWSGLDFSHLQTMSINEDQVNALCWLNDGEHFITGDASGTIHYFEWTMSFLRKIPSTHNAQAVQSLSAAPGYANQHFVSAGDDKCLRIWNWASHQEQRCLEGHGHKVLSVDWHPSMSLIASGSKDNTVKLWDPRSNDTECLATLHGHKLDVLQVAWSPLNGNWLLSSSRDHTLRLFDIRSMKDPVTLMGHKREVFSIAWHPTHERLFASGDFDGDIAYWLAGETTPETVVKASMDRDKAVLALAWHPLGHVLASGSRDQTVKFWTRRIHGHHELEDYKTHTDRLKQTVAPVDGEADDLGSVKRERSNSDSISGDAKRVRALP